MSFINFKGPAFSRKRAIEIPGINAIVEIIPTIIGASILIIVTPWNINQEIAFSILTINPKNMNKLNA